MDKPAARGYLPIDGIVAPTTPSRAWSLAPTPEPVTSGRVATVQAIGGTGGLKIGADFLKKVSPDAKVLISDPSWENHRALFANAGFTVELRSLRCRQTWRHFDGMLASLNAARPASSSCCTPVATTPPGRHHPAQGDG